ncbi:MAG: hypothetical protein DRQ46_00425 [Gammaproteobacteria bacterium]|nr:MAG: hypothetical protein DRQ46_00425 [Gammaproteobacteria bacterium]
MKKIIKFAPDYFLPHQQEFLDSEAKQKALVTGYGGGKTFAFIWETFMNHLFLVNKEGQSNGWIVYPTFSMAEELFVEPFLMLLDRYEIDYKYNSTKHLISSEYGKLRLYQLQTPHRMVGAELTFLGFDEFDIGSYKNCDIAYKKGVGRLRGSNKTKMYFVTTPEGYHYIHKLFVEDNEEGERHLIKAKSTDNPYLPADYIDDLRKNYDSKLVEQYMNGEFVNLRGSAAYYEFDRERHCKDFGIHNAEKKPQVLYMGMDFNVDPMSAVVAIKRDNKLIMFDEIILRNSNTRQMIDVIKERYPGAYISIAPDQTGGSRKTSAEIGVTDIHLLKQAGFKILGSGTNPSVKDSLNAVNAALYQGRLEIDKRCTALTNDFEKVVRDDAGEIDKKDSNLSHISDAGRYLVWSQFPLYGSAIRTRGR